MLSLSARAACVQVALCQIAGAITALLDKWYKYFNPVFAAKVVASLRLGSRGPVHFPGGVGGGGGGGGGGGCCFSDF